MPSSSSLIHHAVAGKTPYFLLLLFCLCLYLPGLTSLPPTDRDEARFAQASKQMLETGDFVDIRFQDTPRYKKPIGIYWLQAASATLAGGPQQAGISAYRVPSVVGAILAVLLTFYFGQLLFGRPAAFLAAGLLAASLLLTVEAHLAKTDAMLLACITAMQGALGKIYFDLRQEQETAWPSALIFWAACGAGFLIKGPVPLAIALLTIITLSVADRNFALLRPLRVGRGLLLLAAMALPWLIAINQASHGTFVRTALTNDLLPKLISGQESHGALPGYYLLLSLALLWPGSIFAARAVRPTWKLRSATPVRFCLAWIIPAWLMFELVPTKLPHYILPVLPAVFLLTGNFLCRSRELEETPSSRLFTIFKWPVMVLWGLITLILGLAPMVLTWRLNGQFFVVGLLSALGAGLMLIWFFRQQRNRNLQAAAVGTLLMAVLMLVPTLQAGLPNLHGPWVSRTVAELVARHAASATTARLAAVDYHEPSLVFLLGTETQLTDAAGAAQCLAASRCDFALVSERKEQDFLAAARSFRAAPVALERFRGFNYSKGKWMNLALYEKHP